MKPPLSAVLGLLFALGLPQAALSQQTDFFTAKKIACTPDRVTRCSAEDRCESKDATARDKSQPLIIDFQSKQAVVRREKDERPFGAIVEDKVEGEVRKIAVRESGQKPDAPTISLTVTRAGKLTLTRNAGRARVEATCAPAS